MATDPDRDPDRDAPSIADPGASSPSLYDRMSDVVLTGIAVIVPVVVTVYVLQVALRFVEGALQPFVEFLRVTGVFLALDRLGILALLVELGVVALLSEFVALISLVVLVLLVGFVASNPRGERLVGYFDVFVAKIPGIGTVYRSFRRMGDIMLDDEVENFREVKLVELFDGSYVIGFEVGRSPPVVSEALATADSGGTEIVTMFVPFAPNPVTGGFLTYVPADDLVDVDMTVEEGVRNVITSGVAGHESDRAAVDVSAEDVRELLAGEAYTPDEMLGGLAYGSDAGGTDPGESDGENA